MSVSRLEFITKIGVEDMGDLADQLDNPKTLRLEKPGHGPAPTPIGP